MWKGFSNYNPSIICERVKSRSTSPQPEWNPHCSSWVRLRLDHHLESCGISFPREAEQCGSSLVPFMNMDNITTFCQSTGPLLNDGLSTNCSCRKPSYPQRQKSNCAAVRQGFVNISILKLLLTLIRWWADKTLFLCFCCGLYQAVLQGSPKSKLWLLGWVPADPVLGKIQSLLLEE